MNVCHRLSHTTLPFTKQASGKEIREQGDTVMMEQWCRLRIHTTATLTKQENKEMVQTLMVQTLTYCREQGYTGAN